MTVKRIVSLVMVLMLCLSAVSFSGTASVVDKAQTGYQIDVTTYDQLKNLLYNSPNGETYVLQNDIIIEDNTNDKTLIVGSLSECTIDLNGYTLGRTTRGIDNCLIRVNDGAEFVIKDSSKDNSGKMFFRAGNYAGTNAVVFIDGEVDIYGGTFEIFTPYKVGGGVVLLVEQGLLNIHDGVFDSHEADGGDTIELRHIAYMYDVPHCNVYGGTFYGKYSNFEVSSYSNFAKNGCFYPTVYVYDGEFYIANPDYEYAGFAYCNNGWGQVIVAGGTVFYKCLNKTDEKYIDGVTKNLISVDYEGKTGAYYEVTLPTMIGNDYLLPVDRLTAKFAKKEVSYYSTTGNVYIQNKDNIDAINNYIDTIDVVATQEKSPLIWIENNESVKTVSWYFSDEAHFNGENTVWSELADYAGRVNPFRFNFRPEKETTLYFRALITFDDETQIEDVVKVHYEEMKLNPPITHVDIIGIDEPVAGEHPDFSPILGSSAYYMNLIQWKDVEDRISTFKETDVFEAGHTYELEIWLRANDGYKFNTDSDDWVDITATVGGKSAEAIGNEIAVILTVTYTLSDEEIPTQPDEFLLGDANSDKDVTITDATTVQRHVAKLTTLTGDSLKAADVSKDGEVSIVDATTIQRFVAKIITEF